MLEKKFVGLETKFQALESKCAEAGKTAGRVAALEDNVRAMRRARGNEPSGGSGGQGGSGGRDTEPPRKKTKTGVVFCEAYIKGKGVCPHGNECSQSHTPGLEKITFLNSLKNFGLTEKECFDLWDSSQ